MPPRITPQDAPDPNPAHDLENPRKRTKTGCLTCRRRRIKCGEERPICRNCIKSKRHCDGYNPRVSFRPNDFDYRQVSHGGAHIIFPAGPVAAPPLDASSLGAAYPQFWQQQCDRNTMPNGVLGWREPAGMSTQPHQMPIASLPLLQPGSRVPLRPQMQPTPFPSDAGVIRGADAPAISPHEGFCRIILDLSYAVSGCPSAVFPTG
ncbi:hypothetical protein MRB53_037755 [Persea americana]|nr:hypothetical protein MRB53_037755 [Persea americana]